MGGSEPATLSARATYIGLSVDGKDLRAMQIRLTWVLKFEAGAGHPENRCVNRFRLRLEGTGQTQESLDSAMPASLSIAIFIFGAVLLLIGLLGGAFKLFGTEVTGTVGPRVRIAALILGVGFIAWGLAIEHHSSAGVAMPATRAEMSEPATPRGTALAAEPAATRTMPTAPQQSAAEAFNLSGMWRDESGTVYQVSQRGNLFEFQASNALTGARAEGTVRLQGRNWTSDFRTNIPSTGTGSGMLSEDGNQIIGSYRDTSYGSYSHTLVRIQ